MGEKNKAGNRVCRCRRGDEATGRVIIRKHKKVKQNKVREGTARNVQRTRRTFGLRMGGKDIKR